MLFVLHGLLRVLAAAGLPRSVALAHTRHVLLTGSLEGRTHARHVPALCGESADAKYGLWGICAA